jgi:hypothetical protein
MKLTWLEDPLFFEGVFDGNIIELLLGDSPAHHDYQRLLLAISQFWLVLSYQLR